MKGCHHLWGKTEDGHYFCCLCAEKRDSIPQEMLKQTTLGNPKDSQKKE